MNKINRKIDRSLDRWRRSNHMTCRLDRLWPPTWLGFQVRSGHSKPFQAVSIEVRDYGALRLKTDRVFLEIDAKTDSQSDLNWSEISRKRSLKTTFAQGPQKGPIPTPLNLEIRAPVQAPALFSLSHPCPKRCPKGSQKRSQGTLKSTKNSNKTVFNKKPQIDTHRSRNCPQGTPKSSKNSSKRDPKCGREPTPQNGPSLSPNGCQNGFPKQFKLAQILSKEVSRNVLNETNSGK